MATDDNVDLTFYPAFCFKASPTHFTWVKMSAADVHRLRRLKEFVGENIFFYNNHPIRFVSLVGLIVARTEITRRTILTLDDSSGATIDIAVLQQTQPKPNANSNNSSISTRNTNQTTSDQADPEPEPTPWSNFSITSKPHRSQNPNPQQTHMTATENDPINITSLQPGTTIRIKGTLSLFRSSMQINLERFTLVPDTNAEMAFLDERLRFLIEVLSVPWELSDAEVEGYRVDAEMGDVRALEERRRIERRGVKRREREERDAKVIAKRYEREEREREREGAFCREDGVRVMRRFGWEGDK
ncbi:hypothetical protein N7499_011589 [Penicillium canescens]|uniref:CST complex subunit Stn1 N-terminal domain-containing protein n=1 Tax=Penicillium canescens TaxID=5083 RepID=A0AAD6IKK2_PENCN|nr:hypothetical protein N7522_011252 [Penicillium canescens]KAJ6049824.1 hypothetical protein N7444_006540 [Penicillium canescens]KAJ6052206.1 hypothetical protein N7460_002740 [Penicillium canescens]KAJ6069702.1 hypothetical protein N7499_011589 [Penicillium canescens]KAJ6182246.1 hypothetical protein N7485_000888 [Penicillium canescens]